MNIGIITINDDNNYGNRLQNYATQMFLRKLDLNPITIRNSIRLNKNQKDLKYFLKFVIEICENLEKKIIITKRRLRFKEFNKNIKFNNKIINWYGNYKKISDSCDAFVVGSDQVWNPYGRMSDVELLNFTNKTKVAFAASLSISEFPNIDNEKIKNDLLKFSKISVREDAGKKIIEDLTGRKDIEVLIDPTMLLTANEWDCVSKKPKQLENFSKRKYILNYFLGELSKNRKEEINRIAIENDCNIINMLDKNDPFYQTGPSEFLYLIKNAFLICTDSFHSSVFSILYNKPFIVFDREGNRMNMNSRIETLLTKFKLKDKKFIDHIKEENLICDYTEAYNILEKEREKAKAFLKKALNL